MTQSVTQGDQPFSPHRIDMDSKLSFTIRRPTPVSRATSSGPDSDTGSFKIPPLPRHLVNANGSPLARSATSSPRPARQGEVIDSSDEEDAEQDELITGFDSLGAQRCVSSHSKQMQLVQLTEVPFSFSANGEKRRSNAPLVIPALKNKDWRELARKRRSTGQFVPSSAKTGKDGSVGGLGTRELINSGPVLSGLQIKTQVVERISDSEWHKQETTDVEMVAPGDESEDQKALRAILAESTGETVYDGSVIDVIPTPISEADALKQDVNELPDPATLEDYTRVPVTQFGAALLRGMGWKEGTAASRKPGKGLVEPYLPVARPSLLGIGAKEQEIYDDGNGKDKQKRRPDKRYIPVVKQERSGTSTPLRDGRTRSRSPRRSAAPSRRSSRSPDRGDRSSDNRRYDNQERNERREDKNKRRYDDYRTDEDRRRDNDRDRERNRGDERQHRRRGETSRRREDERDPSESRKERSLELRKD